MEQLRLVMQQKKERREARKLKISPYNVPHASHIGHTNQSMTPTMVPVPLVSTSNSLNGSMEIPTGSVPTSNHLNTSDSSSSSSATATAIATSITSNNSEIENHLEEVDTVA